MPEGSVALDSSVLIELIGGTEKGAAVLEALSSRRSTSHVSWVNIMETEYIVCRKVGHDRARKSVKALLESGFLRIDDNPLVHQTAASIKCQRAISIVDCYTFAVAEVTSSVPIFASEEAEIVREMKKKRFDTQPVFLTKDDVREKSTKKTLAEEANASEILKKVGEDKWTDSVRKSRDER
jgi:predicted nucleic acid-binding protein